MAGPLLLDLWRTGDDAASRSDGVLLAGLRARHGLLGPALDVLKEAEGRKLPVDHLLDIAAAIGAGTPQPAEAAARLRASADAVRSPERAALTATLLERAGNPKDAIVFYEVAERERPADPTFPRQLARLRAVTGDLAGLEKDLRHLLDLSPQDFTARVNLVRRLVASGRTEEAVREARTPEGVLPEAERQTRAGRILVRAGLPKPGVEAYEEALEADPERCDARFGRAEALLAAGRRAEGVSGLWALVEKPVAGSPCHVAESARLLLDASPKAGTRLARLASTSGGADRAGLREILAAKGLLPHDAKGAPRRAHDE